MGEGEKNKFLWLFSRVRLSKIEKAEGFSGEARGKGGK